MIIKKIIRKLIDLNIDEKERLIKYGAKVGKGAFIGEGCIFDYDFAFLLEIGDGAVISTNSIVELHDSCIPNVRGEGKLRVGRVIIGDRAYIGDACTILPGVIIGKGSIVGAGSLINKSIPADEVWAGVPAKFICKVDELIEKRKNSDTSNNELVYDIDYIGEIEKLSINYQEYKKNKAIEVKKHFNIS